MRLPNADRAIIEPAKLHDYLLSATHPLGRFKARFFATLGYSAERWDRLATDLRQQHLPAGAEAQRPSVYGRKYEIRAMLNGPTGRAHVVSVWVIRADEDFPRFVTAYPGEPR